jgi:hypothetical protein
LRRRGAERDFAGLSWESPTLGDRVGLLQQRDTSPKGIE